MSEFDSRSGGRKGFVRDVMRRISTPPNDPDSEERPGAPDRPSSARDEIEDHQNALRRSSVGVWTECSPSTTLCGGVTD